MVLRATALVSLAALLGACGARTEPVRAGDAAPPLLAGAGGTTLVRIVEAEALERCRTPAHALRRLARTPDAARIRIVAAAEDADAVRAFARAERLPAPEPVPRRDLRRILGPLPTPAFVLVRDRRIVSVQAAGDGELALPPHRAGALHPSPEGDR